jgi:hypothetical protein
MTTVPIRRTIVDREEQIPENNENYTTMDEVFGRFEEIFKQYKENTKYEDWNEVKIFFDSKMLQVDDTTDIEEIIREISLISSRMFNFGYIYESQQKVVQQLEEEFETWLAEKYIIVDHTPIEVSEGITAKYVKRTENAKEKLIITAYNQEYTAYKSKIADEKFKLGLVGRVVKGLESFSFKLDSILKYRQMAIQRGL